jgi:hypothetical protein
VTVQDETGDAVDGAGTVRPGRTYVDIRSVTLTRLSRGKLRVVVETVAPLKVESYLTFRYVDPKGREEAELVALFGRGTPFVYVGSTQNRQYGVSREGTRVTLKLDIGVRNVYYLKWHPSFRWSVKVERDDYMSDVMPSPVDPGVDRFASFP